MILRFVFVIMITPYQIQLRTQTHSDQCIISLSQKSTVDVAFNCATKLDATPPDELSMCDFLYPELEAAAIRATIDIAPPQEANIYQNSHSTSESLSSLQENSPNHHDTNSSKIDLSTGRSSTSKPNISAIDEFQLPPSDVMETRVSITEGSQNDGESLSGSKVSDSTPSVVENITERVSVTESESQKDTCDSESSKFLSGSSSGECQSLDTASEEEAVSTGKFKETPTNETSPWSPYIKKLDYNLDYNKQVPDEDSYTIIGSEMDNSVYLNKQPDTGSSSKYSFLSSLPLDSASDMEYYN